jgi:hypothetical protein
MTNISKTAGLSSAAVCALLATLLVAFVQEAVSQRTSQTFEGYYAPVYSPDGQYVYFVERYTSAVVEQTKPPDIFSTPPQFDVQVTQDTFFLKRLHVTNGQIEELRRLPPSPLDGQHYAASGGVLEHASARLKFRDDGQLEFRVCLSIYQEPRSKEYLSLGMWAEAKGANEINDAWKQSYCELSGYNEWPLFGDCELLEVPGAQYFPVAIVAYNQVTREIKVLIKNKNYDEVFPDGVPLEQILKTSKRPGMERDRTVRRVHEELLQKYRAMGMGEVQAYLHTSKDMQRLGYYPKTPTIMARRLGPADIAKIPKDALFKIARDEMQSGIFPDIARAIARPGEEIDKNFDGYLTHRDYSTSARLNKFLQTGKIRFYVQYLGGTYELTIKRFQ